MAANIPIVVGRMLSLQLFARIKRANVSAANAHSYSWMRLAETGGRGAALPSLKKRTRDDSAKMLEVPAKCGFLPFAATRDADKQH